MNTYRVSAAIETTHKMKITSIEVRSRMSQVALISRLDPARLSLPVCILKPEAPWAG
jgi:hypothetical protein